MKGNAHRGLSWEAHSLEGSPVPRPGVEAGEAGETGGGWGRVEPKHKRGPMAESDSAPVGSGLDLSLGWRKLVCWSTKGLRRLGDFSEAIDCLHCGHGRTRPPTPG